MDTFHFPGVFGRDLAVMDCLACTTMNDTVSLLNILMLLDSVCLAASGINKIINIFSQITNVDTLLSFQASPTPSPLSI